MTDLRQAAQQALEALGSGNPYHQKLAAKVLRTVLEQKAEPTCPDCKEAVLYECVACSSNNYPPQQQADPPQRQWVGLTDEEILRADPWMGTSDSNINPYQILLKVRTLEAKLKERNT